MIHFRRAGLAALLSLAAWPAAMAQAAPTAQEIIEQLKPPATRSLGTKRGFKVQAVEAATSETAVTPFVGQPAFGVQRTTAGPTAPPVAEPATTTTTTTPPPPPPSVSLSIEFDFNSARVRAGSLPVLNTLAQALQSPALKDARFRIEGHTDAAGRADYNQRLSTQRAQAVSSILVAHGVALSRLSSVGKGSSELADAAQPTAAANRRVKIVNLE